MCELPKHKTIFMCAETVLPDRLLNELRKVQIETPARTTQLSLTWLAKSR